MRKLLAVVMILSTRSSFLPLCSMLASRLADCMNRRSFLPQSWRSSAEYFLHEVPSQFSSIGPVSGVLH